MKKKMTLLAALAASLTVPARDVLAQVPTDTSTAADTAAVRDGTMAGDSTVLSADSASARSASGQDVIEAAAAAGTFPTLAKAIEAAGLTGTLKGEGPFTVFAPTDEAFAKLPAGALDSLLADTAQLRRVLLYHVVPGKVASRDVAKMRSATTAEGSALPVMDHGGQVMVGKAMVTAADVPAENGVIHVIDTVLMPPAANEPK